MRTTHTTKTLPRRVLLVGIALVALATLVFANASWAQVTARLAASAPVKKLFSVVPASWQAGGKQSVAKQPSAPRELQANSASLATSASLFDAPLSKIASPPDGTAVARGQVITYTLTLANDAAVDETFPTNRLRVRDAIPANTTYEPGSVTILQQPGNGSALWACSYDGGNNRIECLTAEGGDLREFAVFKFEFKVRVNNNAPFGTILSNQAQFFNEQQSGVGTVTNSSNTTNHPVAAAADLALSKVGTPAVVTAGGTSNPLPGAPGTSDITYELQIGNNGPNDGQNVVVEDQIPANTVVVSNPAIDTASITVNGAAQATFAFPCAVNASGFITCSPGVNTALNPGWASGVLPNGFRGTIRYRVRVQASIPQGMLVVNNANIASRALPGQPNSVTADPNSANNAGVPTSTMVVAGSNLAITKIVQSGMTPASNPNQTGPIAPGSPTGPVGTPGTATTGTPVIPGTTLTYRLTVVNNGPSDAVNVQVVDTLPTNVTYVSANQISGNATFTCFNTGGAVTCNAPLLPAPQPNIGNQAVIDIVVKIDPATKASLVNRARVTGTANGLNTPIGAETQLTTPVQPVSDLVTTKTHTPEPAVAGQDITYTIKVINNGPSTAAMFTITDQLPTGQRFKSAEVLWPVTLPGMPPPMTCTVTTPAAPLPGAGDLVTCAGPAPNGFALQPTEFVTLKLIASIDPCTDPGVYQNVATATSMSALPTPARNVAIDTVTVKVVSDMAITKTDTPDPVIAGNLLTYVMVATNNGPSCARNVMIIDNLPPGTVFISAVASPGATLTTPAVGANGQVMATWPGLTTVGQTRTLTIVVRVCPDYQQSFLANVTPVPPLVREMCQPNLRNIATVKSDSEEPNPANNTAIADTTVQAQSELEIIKSGPSEAPFSTTGNDSIVTYTLNFRNNGPSNSHNTMVVDVLPKGFTLATPPTSTVPGTTFDITTNGGIITVKANLGVLGAANQCVTARPISGTIVIRAKVPIKHPISTVVNEATINGMNCLPDPIPANNRSIVETRITEPGVVGISYPANSQASDIKGGSVLFYPIYTSDATNSNLQNARINITNVAATERVCVHLFLVDGASCAVLDAFICLTPGQTSSFLASDLDPGNTGYLVALAVDCETGLPRAYNCLIGDEFVKFSSGHQANLGAESIAAEMMFPGGVDPNVTLTTLRFDGMNYNRLPRILSADNIPSPADGNQTMMIIDRVGGNFATTGATIGNLTGLLFDDTENSFSFTANLGVCQYRTILSNSFPRTPSTFSRVIPAGRSGWMKFWAFEDSALFGAMINFNATANSNASAYNQGHNLHVLRLTEAATIVVPVYIPSC